VEGMVPELIPEEAREPDLVIAALRIWIHGRQFPNSDDYWDGNWLRVTASWIRGGSAVTARGSFIHLGELVGLSKECDDLYKSLSGRAELKCMEPELGVVLEAKSLGHVDVLVNLTPDHVHEKHEFRASLDQTFLPAIVSECQRILETYPLRNLR
jgi:hypothetical protein